MNVRAHNARQPFEIAATIVRALLLYILVVLAASVIALWAAPNARAQSATPAALTGTGNTTDTDPDRISREYLIKAAILYNLAVFATWPDTAFSAADAPLRVCILGRNPFGPALESLHGKRIGARKLVTAEIADIENAPACHVLFVGASEQERLDTIIDAVSQWPVLTVAEFSQFTTAGGIVGLTEVDNRSRLEVNVGAADLAGVKLSSKLLRLAVTVDTQSAQLNVPPKK